MRACLLLLLAGCASVAAPPDAVVSPAQDAATATELPKYAAFTDRAAEAGLQMLSVGSSSCIVLDDLDLDGLDDAAWTVGGTAQKGVSLQVAFGTSPGVFGPADVITVPDAISFLGCAVADLSRAGRKDVIVVGFDMITVFRQSSPRVFTAEIVPGGQPEGALFSGVGIIDADRDGWPDVIAMQAPGLRFSKDYDCIFDKDLVDLFCPIPADTDPSLPPMLFANQKGALVRAPDRMLPLPKPPHFLPLSIVTSDFDMDGLMDAYMAIDFGTIQFYRGRPDGTLEEVSVPSTGVYAHGMGSTVADFNRDGRADLMMSDQGPSMLFVSRVDGGFDRVEKAAGIAEATETVWGWGVHADDFDNDGDIDIYQSNQFSYPTLPGLLVTIENFLPGTPPNEVTGFPPEVNLPKNDYFLTNLGKERFGRQLIADWDVDIPQCLPLVAFSDVDRDGDVDVLQVLCDIVRLMRNDTPSGGAWLEVVLRGTASTTEAFGAQVTVTTASGVPHRRWVAGAQGFNSWSSQALHFGLGVEHGPATVHVRWPTGCEQAFEGEAVNRRIALTEPSACP